MGIEEILAYLKENIKGLQIYEDSIGVYLGQKVTIDYDLKLQIEFYDDDTLCSIQYWVEDVYGQIGEDQAIYEVENIEEIVYYFRDFPKAYNKVSLILYSVIPIAEEFGVDIVKLLNDKI